MNATTIDLEREEYQQALAAIDELVSTPTRVRILRRLAAAETLHRDELSEHVEASRTTLTRNLDTLERLGWIRHSGSEYSVNPCGKLVVEELDRLLDRTCLANRLENGLRGIADTSLDVDLRRFADATLLLPEPGNPYEMINRHVTRLRHTDSCRGVLRLTGLHATEAGHEMICEKDGEAELVVAPAVARTFRSNPNYAELIAEMRETGRFEVFVYDDQPPYSVVVMDETVHLAFDEDGNPGALIESSASGVRDWALETFREYRTEAERMSACEVGSLEFG